MNTLKLITLAFILLVGSAYTNETDKYDDLRKQSNEAFTYGEQLKYRVHYGWINAASVDVNVAEKPVNVNGRSTYQVSAYGKTFRSFDWAFRVRDHFVSYIDSQSVAPLKYWKKVEEDNYRDEDLV